MLPFPEKNTAKKSWCRPTRHLVEQEGVPCAQRTRSLRTGLAEGQTCFSVLHAVRAEVVHGMQTGSWKIACCNTRKEQQCARCRLMLSVDGLFDKI